MRLHLEDIPQKKLPAANVEISPDRAYTRKELVKMRRRLIEDCEIYEARARHKNSNDGAVYHALLEASHKRIEQWIQKQLLRPERYHAITIDQARSKKSPRGQISFLVEDGSVFSIQETDPYHGNLYSKELIQPVFSQHVFIDKDQAYDLSRLLSEENGIRHVLKTEWNAGSLDHPGSVLLQYEPRDLRATAEIRDGKIIFASKEDPTRNPAFDHAVFFAENVLRLGNPIERIMSRVKSPKNESYAP